VGGDLWCRGREKRKHVFLGLMCGSVTVLLSLITAALFGTGDFCGGVASRRAPLWLVVGGAHFVGLLGVALAALLVAPIPGGRDLALGALGGLFGLVGLGLLYRGLAVGPMQVVAPITAIASAAGPIVWSLVAGETLPWTVWLGVTVALPAIGLVSWAPNEESSTGGGITATTLVGALGAGVGFAGFFIALDATSEASAPWPVVSSRVASVTVLALGVGAYFLTRRQQLAAAERGIAGELLEALRSGDGRHGGFWGVVTLIVLAGITDSLANVGFLYAVQFGQLAVVAVLTSLYPIATAAWARVVLDERLTRPQTIGFVGALLASGLLAVG